MTNEPFNSHIIINQANIAKKMTNQNLKIAFRTGLKPPVSVIYLFRWRELWSGFKIEIL